MELQWPLMVFTTFICLSAGTFGTIAIASLREGYERIELPGLIFSFVALVIGGVASVLHLQTPARYFGQFGNIASGINQEIIAMALVGIMMVVYFIQLKRGGKVNGVVKVVSALLSLVLVLVMSHSYTMAAIPAWNTVLLPIYYVVNAVLLGILATLLLRALGRKDPARNSKLSTAALVAVVVFALGIAAYTFFFSSLSGSSYSEVLHVDTTTVPPVDPAAIGERLLSGDLSLIFWGGVVAIGLVLPFIALVVAKKTSGTNTAVLSGSMLVSIVLVLVGNVAFRALLYFAGASVFVY